MLKLLYIILKGGDTMSRQSDILIEQEQEYMESLTEGQLADYLVEQGMFDFDED